MNAFDVLSDVPREVRLSEVPSTQWWKQTPVMKIVKMGGLSSRRNASHDVRIGVLMEGEMDVGVGVSV